MEFLFSLSSCNLLFGYNYFLLGFAMLGWFGILGWVWDLLCTSCMRGPAPCIECYAFIYIVNYLLRCVPIAKGG